MAFFFLKIKLFEVNIGRMRQSIERIEKEECCMKTLVVGANGKIGKILVGQLKEEGKHLVRALVRAVEQREVYANQGIETVLANLEGSVDELAAAMEGCDAVVFTAGSGGSTGADKTLLIDLDGAVKTMEAAEKAGIERFIMVSALQAHNRENWNEHIRPYYVAKHYADRMLLGSNLNYTIIRPGGLTDEPATGRIQVGEDLSRGFIPRSDVAKVIAASLDDSRTYKRSFDLVSGEEQITEAFNGLA